MTMAPGARSFRAFCATLERPETKQNNIFTTHIIPEDDEESFQPKDPVEPRDTKEDSNEEITLPIQDEVVTPPQSTVLDLGPIPHVIPDEQEPKSLDPKDELMRWHYRLGHLPFDSIKQLADKGQLPKRLLTCHTPFCAACQYGKMTKRPWRVKGDDKGTAKTATYPGQVVPVDQLESTSPGFIAQLKEHSHNNGTDTQLFSSISSRNIRTYTCKNASPVRKRSWPSTPSSELRNNGE